MSQSILVILRRQYLELLIELAGEVERKILRCAAKLIDYFRHLKKYKLQRQRTGWAYKKLTQIYDDLMGEHSIHVIRAAIAVLEELGLLEKRNNPGNGQDRTYQYRLNTTRLEQALEDLCGEGSKEPEAETRTQPPFVQPESPTFRSESPSFSVERHQQLTSIEDISTAFSQQKEIFESVNLNSQESPKSSAAGASKVDICQDSSQTLNNSEQVNHKAPESPVEINIPPRRATKVNKRQKFEWEVEVNRPHKDFVSWRANTHYTPQGSHWAAGAVSNAFSEIVNKSNNCPEKAQALWEQFLEYAKRSAENAQERINNGMEAWLPSCFDEKPQLDAQQVGQELLALKQQIHQQEQAKALPAPQPPQPEVLENQPLTLEQRVKNRQLMWNSGGAVIRQVIVEWVKETPGVVMTPNGPALEADVQPEVDSAATNPSTTANPHQDAGTAAAAPRPPKSPTLAEQVSCRRFVWASPSVAPEVRQQIQQWAENTPGVVMTPDGPALE